MSGKINKSKLGIILCIGISFFMSSCGIKDKAEEKFRIAIFREEGFPASGTPALLTPEWLHASLAKDFSVVYLNAAKLSAKGHLRAKGFDLLILPYGEAFPLQAFDAIYEYISGGGGILNTAGRPFWIPFEKKAEQWQRVDVSNPYEKFLSVLGIKYYESAQGPDIGLGVTTSWALPAKLPTHGNVFPYRIPARDFYSADTLEGVAKYPATIFIKSWDNPYMMNPAQIPQKWCLIGARGFAHPLNPANPAARKNLIGILEYLSFPLIISNLETAMASYHSGEKVVVSLEVCNIGRFSQAAVIDLKFLDDQSSLAHQESRNVELAAGEKKNLEYIWQPQALESNFYKIRAALKKGEKEFDWQENGFVVAPAAVLKSAVPLEIKGKAFERGGKKFMVLGTNYYESRLGELIWVRPNIAKIREDFQSMKKLGINFVRIHYHHSKWFRDYYRQVMKIALPPYLRLADTTVLPSERSLRILDALIQLAQQEGLVICLDIFSLTPEEMGDPIGWLGLKERIIDKDKIAQQKKFVSLIARRYKDVPGLSWDLWNEPRLEDSDLPRLRAWAKALKDEFRKNQDTHLITIGDNLSLKLLDILDYASIHTDNPRDFISLKNLPKPFIFQEIWNESGSSLGEEIAQAEKLKKQFRDFLNTESAGFLTWQWTRQSRLWNNAGPAEEWDDELGLCTHDDGTPKAAGKVYASLIKELSGN